MYNVIETETQYSGKPNKAKDGKPSNVESIKQSSLPKEADVRKEVATKKDPQKHRRLSRLHSIHRNDEDLFASAVAATARRASIAVGPESCLEGIAKTGKQTRSIF